MLSLHTLVTPVVLSFKGDSEKFYSDVAYLFKGGNIIDGLDRHGNILFGFELGNIVLSFITTSKFSNSSTFKLESIEFTKRQKEIIAYVSGYVIGTLYRRLRYSKDHQSFFNQQCLSFLQAFKLVDGKETDVSHQKLVDAKNRGGLWKVTSDTITIFMYAETYFLSATKDFVKIIDAKYLTSLLLEDSSVLIYFNSIRRTADLDVKKEICVNLLEDMFILYLRCRSHSYAKDQQQIHKSSKDKIKNRSLRIEIKKTTSNLESGH